MHIPTGSGIALDGLHATLADVVFTRAGSISVPRPVVTNANLEAVKTAAAAVATVPDLKVVDRFPVSQIDPPPRLIVVCRVGTTAMIPVRAGLAIDSASSSTATACAGLMSWHALRSKMPFAKHLRLCHATSVDLDLAQRQIPPVTRNYDVDEAAIPAVTIDCL